MATTAETKTTTEDTKAASKPKKTTTRKTKAKRATTRTLSVVKSAPKKAVRKASKTAKRAVTTTAKAATKTIDTATRIATSKSPTDAAKQFTSFFQQTPFKLESLMNTKSFPQMDQFQTQMQSAANEATAYMTKAQTACEKSSKTLASGMEECGKTIASMMQANMQRTNDAVRALASCRTINEFADVQTKLSKQYFDATSTETAKLVEQLTKTMTAAAAPVSDLATEAMSKAKKSMAA